jgi:hypothetical protein
MSPSINLEIAGITIKIFSKFNLGHNNKFYRSFYKEGDSGRSDIQIEADLLTSNLLNIGDMETVFDGEQGWSMYKKNDEFFIFLNAPSFKDPLWLTRLNEDFSKGSVYYSKVLVTKKEGTSTIFNPASYPLDQILIMHKLSRGTGLLVHAAGIDINGKGLVFPGKSGAGKSTLSRQLIQKYGFKLFSDDRMIIRRVDRNYFTYGTPWPGELGVAQNKGTPLDAVLFINHGTTNRIDRIKPNDALKNIFPMASIPWYNKELIAQTVSFLEEFFKNIPAYNLYFKPHKQIADDLENFLK